MGAASIVLGLLSVIFAVAGALLTVVPFLGAALSFGSPLLALVGGILGGVAYSRAKEEGGESGVPLAGLIISIIAFFPGIFVALTCGVCNSMCSTGALNQSSGGSQTPYWLLDGGNVTVSPGITPPPAPNPSLPPDPMGVPDPNAVDPNAVDPNAPPADPNAPPPAFPPPP